MPNSVDLPAGLKRWPSETFSTPRLEEGFEIALLEDCENAYRFTAMVSVGKLITLVNDFSRFLGEEAFFILEHYPEESLALLPGSERPAPLVHYSPYLPIDELLQTVAPYYSRLIHDGFVGFGLANNRQGIEFFYSEEKVLTFFTDNHLRLSNFLYKHQIPHCPQLTLPADFGHDHLSLLGYPKEQLPVELQQYSDRELDMTIFCDELIESLDMYKVEEGLSFFLTRKEQDLIAELMNDRLSHDELSTVEFGGLLLDWSDFVTECEHGFEGDLWEYRQGLKIRDTIQAIIEITPVPLAKKITNIVAEPDQIFQETLTDRRKRLDPPSAPQLQQERFWYQGVVRKQGTDLRRDLIRQGWFKR